MIYYSPLRYPGGKGKLTKFIKDIFEKNDLQNGCYVEPYAGGASVALSLLSSNHAKKIIINDYDRSIYAFWYSAIFDTNNLCNLIRSTRVNMTIWRAQKKVQKRKETANLLELGFSTFFLNRTNRSGVINAGVIGGNNQEGNYKINARYNKKELISRIENIGKLRDKITLYNLDAIELVRVINRTLPRKTLIYFDPPYYVKGKDLYVNYYIHEDHVLVSEMINGIRRHKWIVSYDNDKEIRKIYKNNRKITYSLNYSAVNATSGTEVMIYHESLKMPRKTRPTLAK